LKSSHRHFSTGQQIGIIITIIDIGLVEKKERSEAKSVGQNKSECSS
jgi:hypothetical protein